MRMNDDRGVTGRLGQVSGRPERLDGVTEIVEQLAPPCPTHARNGLAQLVPPAGRGQPRSIEMLGSEPLDLQSGDAFGIEAIELLGQQPHRLQPLDRQRALDQTDQRFAADPPHRAVTLGTQYAHVARLLGIVRHEHQWRGAAALPTLPRRSQFRLLDRRGPRVLDPVEQAAGDDAVAICAGVAGARAARPSRRGSRRRSRRQAIGVRHALSLFHVPADVLPPFGKRRRDQRPDRVSCAGRPVPTRAGGSFCVVGARVLCRRQRVRSVERRSTGSRRSVRRCAFLQALQDELGPLGIGLGARRERAPGRRARRRRSRRVRPPSRSRRWLPRRPGAAARRGCWCLCPRRRVAGRQPRWRSPPARG